MKPLNLQEFAEELWRKGDWRERDFAAEIRELLNIEDECAEPYGNLCDDLERAAAEAKLDGKPEKQLEWLIDRSDLLAEIEKELDTDGRTGDTDDQVKAMLETLGKIRDITGLPDTATDEDLEIAVQALVDAAPAAMEYDL